MIEKEKSDGNTEMGLVSKITLMFLTVPTLFLPSGTRKILSITTIYIYVPYVPSI